MCSTGRQACAHSPCKLACTCPIWARTQERREEERRIAEGIGEADRGSGGAFVHSCQRSMFAAMHSYADVTMPCRMYPTSMQDPGEFMLCLSCAQPICCNLVCLALACLKMQHSRLPICLALT